MRATTYHYTGQGDAAVAAAGQLRQPVLSVG